MTIINLFHLGGAYYFKHYFDRREVFEEFRRYYDPLEYRFEVREEEFEEVEKNLRSHGFDVGIVEREEVPDYAVVINKYTKHSDLLKKAVDTLELDDKKALIMKDMVAKEEALERGEKPDEEWRGHL